MATLAVHVTPKSGRDEVIGWRGGELAVRVTVAPEGGKANAAVCKVISAALGVPKSSVRVARGDTSRHKSLAIDGVSAEAVRDAFGEPDEALF
ncbi:MAG: DUF167 domain-containing protein [Coriobacteriia bacterium]|nr:DUF167 domain-containing protein [Coriobacteriia bacterium]